MAKRNPFDTPPPAPVDDLPTFHPDRDINNADWPKRIPDYDGKGNLVQPVVDVKNRPPK